MSGFSNPIIGGGGGLVYPSIHSPDYVAGSAGWSINKDGSVEFNSGTFRGTVSAGTIIGAIIETLIAGNVRFKLDSDGNLNLYNAFGATIIQLNAANGALYVYNDTGSATQGALILVSAGADGVDPLKATGYSAGLSLRNSVHSSLQGLNLATGNGDEAVNAFLAVQAENQGTSTERLLCEVVGAQHSASQDAVAIVLWSSFKGTAGSASGELDYFDSSGTQHQVAYWDSAGLHITGTLFGTGGVITVGDDIQRDTWHPLTLTAGFSAGSPAPQYRKSADGAFLELSGHVTGNTSTGGSADFAAVPDGYFDTANTRIAPVVLAGNQPGTGSPRIKTDTAGNLYIPGFGSSGVALDIWLDGVRLRLK